MIKSFEVRRFVAATTVLLAMAGLWYESSALGLDSTEFALSEILLVISGGSAAAIWATE